jgi:hypothetical protein
VFGLTAGATYTDARIVEDFIDPTVNGKRPGTWPA